MGGFLASWRMVRAKQAAVKGENAKELSAAVLATQANSHDPHIDSGPGSKRGGEMLNTLD